MSRHPLDIVCPRLRTLNCDSVSERLAMHLDKWRRSGTTCVGRRSPLSHRRAVETMAVYFRREFRYDFVQYIATEELDDEETLAFFWADGHFGGYSVIGGCCFRWREWENCDSWWAMQWIWLHPYFRRRGYLSRSWDLFTAMFAPFGVEPPLSESMSRFLSKRQFIERPIMDGVVKLFTD